MKSLVRVKKDNRGNTCLNCYHVLKDTDNFCSQCGQVNDKNRISLKTYFSEYLSGFFSFDNRLLKTVIPLIFKPGFVTLEYINGKRKRFVNPFQLYLHVTILFFLLQGIYNTVDQYKTSSKMIEPKTSITDDIPGSNSQSANNLVVDTLSNNQPKDSSVTLNADTVRRQRKTLTNKFIDSILDHHKFLSVLKNSNSGAQQKDSLMAIINKESLIFATELSSVGTEDDNIKGWEAINNIDLNRKNVFKALEQRLLQEGINYNIPPKYKNSVESEFLKPIIGADRFVKLNKFLDYDKKYPDIDVAEGLTELGYEINTWNIFYYKKAQNFNKMKDDVEYRKSYVDNIISKISVALFFLLPVFTLIVSLLYIRNHNTYTEHLVFVFHTQTVFFILLMFFIVLDRLFNTGWGLTIFGFIFAFYLYKALLNFYEQGKLKTFIKYCILNTFFVFFAVIGLVIISFLAFII